MPVGWIRYSPHTRGNAGDIAARMGREIVAVIATTETRSYWYIIRRAYGEPPYNTLLVGDSARSVDGCKREIEEYFKSRLAKDNLGPLDLLYRKIYESYHGKRGLRLTKEEVETLVELDQGMAVAITNSACSEAGIVDWGYSALRQEETWEQLKKKLVGWRTC